MLAQNSAAHAPGYPEDPAYQDMLPHYEREKVGWFERLFGFPECANGKPEKWAAIREKFQLIPGLDHGTALEPQTLRCLVNDKTWNAGAFSRPTLGEVRDKAHQELTIKRSQNENFLRGRPRVRFEYGDVAELLTDEKFRHATFQVASQFNCLEFIDPNKTPEDGIGIYEYDKTQGPACSIACGPATVVRNYFLQDGQHPINNLQDTLAIFPHKYVHVRGGYTIPRTKTSLGDMRQYLDDQGIFRDASTSDNKNQADMSTLLTSTSNSSHGGAKYLRRLMDSVRVGVHRDVEVTSSRWGTVLFDQPKQVVTQVFCSACALAYADGGTEYEWEPLARLALDSSYEACLWITLLNACRQNSCSGSNTIVLTILGGGAFGNPIHWIADAIGRALYQLQLIEVELDVVINSFSQEVPRRLQQVANCFPCQ
eukprot:Tamp_05632.p1 GENE.Tamp_05632~~Tamp_05632.p1  ORF type:complete len:426 (-),score=55.65 Tamp_05632:419-1696(-)